jgi:carbohydrate-binding DOMON domain-containing protein
MDIIEILKEDYQKFPEDQTYSIYAEDVYFEDPVNKFRGGDRYQKMIDFFKKWFINIQLDLHEINQSGNTIKTRWTLSWTAPVPWQPRMAIPGWSELKLNDEGLIASHIDYWDISRLDVLKQLFKVK